MNETREIRFNLSKTELEEYANVLAEKNLEVARLKEEKKASNSNFGDKIKAAELHIGRCSRALAQKWELREVEVSLRPDYEAGEMVTVVNLTGEEHERRPLTPEERQLRLDDI